MRKTTVYCDFCNVEINSTCDDRHRIIKYVEHNNLKFRLQCNINFSFLRRKSDYFSHPYTDNADLCVSCHYKFSSISRVHYVGDFNELVPFLVDPTSKEIKRDNHNDY